MAGRCWFGPCRKWIIRTIQVSEADPCVVPAASHPDAGGSHERLGEGECRSALRGRRRVRFLQRDCDLLSLARPDDDPWSAARGRSAPIEDHPGLFGGGDPEMQQGADLIDATMAY